MNEQQQIEFLRKELEAAKKERDEVTAHNRGLWKALVKFAGVAHRGLGNMAQLRDIEGVNEVILDTEMELMDQMIADGYRTAGVAIE